MIPKHFSKVIYFIVLGIVLVILIFGENGIIKYYELNKEFDNLKKQIKETELKIEQLDLQIDSLKNSTVKIERIAREKYRMMHSNEIPIKIKTE